MEQVVEFEAFEKIPRLNRDIVITEKIDGTNAQILIADDFTTMLAGSRSRWLDEKNDNYGFWKWCNTNRDELLKLGPGRHYGEWWGQGVNRGYGLKEKRFSLFNTARWYGVELPAGVSVVPVLYTGPFDTITVREVIDSLKERGSVAVPGWMKPEGVVIFHTAGRLLFKVTCENDEKPKGQVNV